MIPVTIEYYRLPLALEWAIEHYGPSKDETWWMECPDIVDDYVTINFCREEDAVAFKLRFG